MSKPSNTSATKFCPRFRLRSLMTTLWMLSATSEDRWRHLSQEGRAFVITNHGGDAVFRRFSHALAELMDPVSEVSVFWEGMQPPESSGFDEDLNAKVVEQTVRQARLDGICN